MNEIWKDIPDLGGKYMVSNFGRIESNTREGKTMLKLSPNTKGYLSFCARKDGKNKTLCVHKCVAEAFLGKCPDGQMVNHKYHDRTNNSPDNLEYVSVRENTTHYYRSKYTGVAKAHGSKNFSANVKINGKNNYLGCFPTPELAHQAYLQALKDHGIVNKYAQAQAKKGE